MNGSLAVGPGRAPAASGRPLRVVIPAFSYHPEWPTGASRLAYDEARYLASCGHEAWLVAMDGGTGQPEHVLDGRLHVLRYKRPRLAAFDPTGGHERAVQRLLSRHVGGDVDVVHAHMLLSGAASFRLYGTRARTCYSLHSPVGRELLAAGRGARLHERLRLRVAAIARRRTEARVLAGCDAITCDSDFTRALVAATYGPTIAGRTRVMPGWVDLARFRPLEKPTEVRRALGWPAGDPVFFCLRRFVPRMGLDALLAATARLRARGRHFHVVLAGEGPLRTVVERCVRDLGLSDQVSLPGGVPDDLLPSMYGAADAFVLPTAELECFGLIALEAMACGRPVLATPVGAIPELLGAVEPRWMACDASADALEALLAEFLDGRLPRRRPEWLRDFVCRRYSMHDRVADLARAAVGDPEAA